MSTSEQENKPVTIIGGGIIGLCCALSLIEKGHQVRLLDPMDETARTSYGNAGVISPWSCVPQPLPGVWKNIPRWLFNPHGPVNVQWPYLHHLLPWTQKFLKQSTLELAKQNSQAMADLIRDTIPIYQRHLSGTAKEYLLQDAWYLQVFREANAIQQDSLGIRLRETQHAPMEVVDGNELHEIEPAISDEYQSALVIKGQKRALSSGHLCQALQDKVRRLGGEVIRCKVHSITPTEANGWLLNTDQGELDSNQLVLAAGIWSKHLLEPLGIHLPLISERGYHLTFKGPGLQLKHSVMDVEHAFVVSSMEDGIRAAGTAEFAHADATANEQRAEVFKPLTKQLLKGLNTDNTTSWMGVRPSFPDSLPCIGYIPNLPNLFAAFGHSHYGMSMAPKTGEIIADLLSGKTPDIDITPYSIQRF